MAQIEKFVPFVLKWAAGVSRKKNESVQRLFARAKKTGWSDDPLDLGGATQCDVTFATYCAYCRRRGLPLPTEASLRDIPYEHWLEILKEMYWNRWNADRIVSQPIAEILVDWVWASGLHGIRRPQRLLGVTPDGIVGPKTLAAVNASDPKELFAAIRADRVKFCEEIVARRPSQRKWLRGWLNRINAITFSLLLIIFASGCRPCRSVVSNIDDSRDSTHNSRTDVATRVRVDSVCITDSIVTVVRGDTVVTEKWHTRIRDRLRVDTVERVRDRIIYRTRTIRTKETETKAGMISKPKSGLCLLACVLVTALLTVLLLKWRNLLRFH